MPEPAIDLRPLRPDPVITGDDTLSGPLVYRRPQGLDHWLLVLTIRGPAWIGPSDAKLLLERGDMMLIEPRRPLDQDVYRPHRWERRWFIFDPRLHWHDWLNWPQVAPGFRCIRLSTLRRGTKIRAHLEAAHQYATGTLRRRRELAMNELEAALLWCDAQNPLSEQASFDARLAGAMDFVCRNLRERLTVARIAERVGLSSPHLTKLFRRQLDVSPMEFVERQRMQSAARLLQMTSQSISAVAEQVGFADPFYFSTRFKRYAGVSPRAYRRAR